MVGGFVDADGECSSEQVSVHGVRCAQFNPNEKGMSCRGGWVGGGKLQGIWDQHGVNSGGLRGRAAQTENASVCASVAKGAVILQREEVWTNAPPS